MSKPQKSILPLIFLTVVIDLIGFGIVIPILPLYGERYGATPLQIGILMGVFSGCQLVLSPIFGQLSDRVGRRPLLLLSMVGACIGYLIMANAQSFTWLLIARVIQGVSGASISTAQAAIADVTSGKDRARGMGLIGAAFGIGFVLGPLIGGIMGHFSTSAPFYFAAALSALNAAMLYSRLPETRPLGAASDSARVGIISSVRSLAGTPVARVILAYLLVTTGFSIMTGMFALFTNDRFKFGELQNGYVFALVGFIAVIVQGGLIGRLVARFGEPRIALIGGVVMTLTMFLLPLANSIPTLLIVSCGLSLGNSLMLPTLNGLASRSIDAHSQGRILGIVQSSGSLGRMLGPFLGGALYRWHAGSAAQGLGTAAFWAGAVLCGVATAAVIGLRQPVAPTESEMPVELSGT
jgi:multidrug resistance protein